MMKKMYTKTGDNLEKADSELPKTSIPGVVRDE